MRLKDLANCIEVVFWELKEFIFLVLCCIPMPIITHGT